MKFLMCGALVACALGVAAAQQQPVFRGGLDAVRVFVTVTDRDGRIVTTLAQDNFEVRDEGKPQPITQFDNSPQPIQLIVMLDVSGSMEGNLPLLRAASGAALHAAAERRRRARRHVRPRGHDQSHVHERRARARRGPAQLHRAGRADAAVARHRRGDGRLQHGGRPPQGDPGAERRQGHRDDEPAPAPLEPGRRDRPRAARRRDDLRGGDAQPRLEAVPSWHGPWRPARHDAGRHAGSGTRARRGRDAAAATSRFASATTSARRSRRSPTSSTRSTCSPSRRRSATARSTRSA